MRSLNANFNQIFLFEWRHYNNSEMVYFYDCALGIIAVRNLQPLKQNQHLSCACILLYAIWTSWKVIAIYVPGLEAAAGKE